MDPEDIANRFTYHRPSENDVMRMQRIRSMCEELAYQLNDSVPEGREKSLALTKLEEVSMWANAGIARNSSERV